MGSVNTGRSASASTADGFQTARHNIWFDFQETTTKVQFPGSRAGSFLL